MKSRRLIWQAGYCRLLHPGKNRYGRPQWIDLDRASVIGMRRVSLAREVMRLMGRLCLDLKTMVMAECNL